MRRFLLAVVVLALIPLASECSEPTADRQGPNGAQPDGYQDMSHVIVYRAPDQVPNIAIGCVGAYGFMTTLKNTSSSTSPSVSLTRFPEYDKVCTA
jgi:hypothetical protein